MADDIEMIPVEMTPVDAAEPPKGNPLAAAAEPKLNSTAALKPGLRLPPKPVVAGGLKLPPKPTATATLKPGMKLPTVALKPGVKLPPKPVIRKPGATVSAMPLPKPVAPAPKPDAAPAAPASAVPAAKAESKPVAVDSQGVGKLPTVEGKAVGRAETAPSPGASPKPLEALKSVTQKLKGVTQEIPQQAILRKTGIISEGAMSEAQKEASKHKTARISLSDAMGVAPVKNENAPIKTIRIKRPVDISGATKTAAPAAAPQPAAGASPAENQSAEGASETQRKPLKLSRPGGAVRPTGKFGIKRPGQANAGAPTEAGGAAEAAAGEPPVADIAEIPEMSAVPMPVARAAASEEPAWLSTLSTIVQAAACIAIGALAWFLFQNTQVAYF